MRSIFGSQKFFAFLLLWGSWATKIHMLIWRAGCGGWTGRCGLAIKTIACGNFHTRVTGGWTNWGSWRSWSLQKNCIKWNKTHLVTWSLMLQGDPTSLEHIPRKLGQSKQNWFVIYFHLRSQLLKKLFLIATKKCQTKLLWSPNSLAHPVLYVSQTHSMHFSTSLRRPFLSQGHFTTHPISVKAPRC